jgi:YidC/Oxa1 family membrane protein insertase
VSAILHWIEVPVSWLLVTFYHVLSPIFGPTSGWSWGLSIVGLVIVIRILLIPLFVKQINAQRNLQIIQPQMKEIQKKYAGDRERQSQEMMKLYRETGTNPLASCLPILLQAPIFYALFRVLQGIATDVPRGVLTAQMVSHARQAKIFGAPISATFVHAADYTKSPYFTSATTIHIVTLILIVLMTLTTFLTQRQLIVKNTARDNPIAQQQRILLYVFPFIFAIGGINFPLGVLIYWLTTNLWSMGQQFYVIRNNPQPGTPAFEAWEARKAKKNPVLAIADATPPAIEPPKRVQPKRQSKQQRKTGPKPGGTSEDKSQQPDEPNSTSDVP